MVFGIWLLPYRLVRRGLLFLAILHCGDAFRKMLCTSLSRCVKQDSDVVPASRVLRDILEQQRLGTST